MYRIYLDVCINTVLRCWLAGGGSGGIAEAADEKVEEAEEGRTLESSEWKRKS